jgi:hypothetical protein
VSINVEIDADDGKEFFVELQSVPRAGEFVSVGHGETFRRFEVNEVWHHNNGEPGTLLFVRELKLHDGRPAFD